MSVEELPRAHGAVVGKARLRVEPEDFRVDEVLPFVPTGSGEHLLVQVEKRNQNTAWVARQLADHAGVAPRDVSFSGQKDRRAVTTQWFSIQLPGRADPDWTSFAREGVRVLATHRHDRKLRRGTHRINRFRIVLREAALDEYALAGRIALIAAAGVPNYFAEQRVNPRALARAHAAVAAGRLPPQREARAMVLSVLRSEVFNAVLAERVADRSWARCLPGELVMLDGTDRFFADDGSEDLQQRCLRQDVHPTGPLPGRGGSQPAAAAGELEQRVLHGYDAAVAALSGWGVDAGRRALRLQVRNLSCRPLGGGSHQLAFALSRGGFATAVLREIVAYEVARDDVPEGAAAEHPE